MKTFIKEIKPYIELHRCPRTGIAWVENGSTGTGHSAHPSICSTGSVKGMKNRGYWNKEDQAVKTSGYIYNISRSFVSDEYDEIARQHCQCGGNH